MYPPDSMQKETDGQDTALNDPVARGFDMRLHVAPASIVELVSLPTATQSITVGQEIASSRSLPRAK
jgi:hypothetical protein